MTARVFVHVGPHKTGSTYLQAVLHRNKEALAADGVLFPGRRYAEQRRAIQQLMRSSGNHGTAAKGWTELVEETRRWEGEVAVLSQEGLAGAGTAAIRNLVESLGDLEVHVVYAVRDLTKVIPGSWHTRMRNGHTESWQEYLRAAHGDADWDPRLWDGLDPRLALPHWEEHVPRERIHVLTVPPSGTPQDVLWKRFSAVVGLDPSRYSLDVPRLNESLGSAETEVLRRINLRVAGRLDRHGYERLVQPLVIRRTLVRRPDQQRYALPVEEHDWVRSRVEEIVAFLRDRGYPVTGDLDDVLPVAPIRSAPAPDDVDLDAALDAATDVVGALLERLDEAARVPPRRRGAPGRRPAAQDAPPSLPARVVRRLRGLTRSH
jgi:hypothetical protein